MIQVTYDFGRFEKIAAGIGNPPTPWQKRILGELRFAEVLSRENGGRFDGEIAAAVSILEEALLREGVISNQSAEAAEQKLLPCAEEAKSYKFLCAAHAHIDMNWMWGFHETVAATVDTFRTMLQIMDEYPDFRFSQSQASVYRILERFAPEMLEEVKARVREGRWELTAAAWVETDKNMPSGESLSRHILYAKEYLSKLFSVDPDSLQVDFDPDTFGHSRNVPEIAAKGGLRYYYHCRGRVGEDILNRWRSPSGAELILYTEPFWYNGEIDTTLAEYAVELARRTGSRTLLKVYGVGDHGGGPTRRDLDALIEMNGWPVYPQFCFSTFHEYFRTVEERRETLPVVEGEINFLCDGCYTTQTRIKAGNRQSERLLQEAELFAAMSAAETGADPHPEIFRDAWEKVLFNHFHDIIPGSGVTETREYASALHQEAAAFGETRRKTAFYQLTRQMDTASLLPPQDTAFTRGEGGGSGFGGAGLGVSGAGACGHSAGKTRIFHLFSSSPWDRTDTTVFTVWDYEGDESRLGVRTADGRWLPSQILDKGGYWGHQYVRLAARTSVPACGYAAYLVGEQPIQTGCAFINDMRVQRPETFVLENSRVRAEFSPATASLVSFVSKAAGRELIPAGKEARFELAQEAVWKEVTGWEGGMSAWFTGRQKSAEPLRGTEMRMLPGGPVRSSLEIQAKFGAGSTLRAVIFLDEDSDALQYQVTCDWREFGGGDGVPCLQFTLPTELGENSYWYDVPFGFVEREGREMDLPANRFVLAKDGSDAMLLTAQTKYGYRCGGGRMAVTLIRGAYEPDPTPEIGRHEISFAVIRQDGGMDMGRYARTVQDYEHPILAVTGRPHAGKRPAEGKFLELREGSVLISAVKPAESGDPKELLVRLYETDGRSCTAEFALGLEAESACLCDQLERPIAGEVSVAGGNIRLPMTPYSTALVKLRLK